MLNPLTVKVFPEGRLLYNVSTARCRWVPLGPLKLHRIWKSFFALGLALLRTKLRTALPLVVCQPKSVMKMADSGVGPDSKRLVESGFVGSVVPVFVDELKIWLIVMPRPNITTSVAQPIDMQEIFPFLGTTRADRGGLSRIRISARYASSASIRRLSSSLNMFTS